MSIPVKILSGLKTNLPVNKTVGELAVATDTHELYHGNPSATPDAIKTDRANIIANGVTSLSPATGSTVALDRNTYKGAIVTVPSGGTLTFTIANMAVGESYLVKLAYAGTATINWFTTLKWINSGGTAPTYSGSNGKVDTFIFFCRTANNYDVHYQLDSGAI